MTTPLKNANFVSEYEVKQLCRKTDTKKDKKKAWTDKSAIQNIDFIHKINHAFDYILNIKFFS